MDLIVGAGITGLSYAMFKGNNDYIIVEKESEIGGYCRTIKHNGFVWDFSGHFFHFQDPFFYGLFFLFGFDISIRRIGEMTRI